MKKIFFFAALAAAVSFTSCSNDDDIVGSTSNTGTSLAKTGAITFTTTGNATTRASYGEEIESLDQFYVSAKTSDNASYFQNVVFSLENDGIFTSGYTYYWPTSGTLSFTAVNQNATWGTSSVNTNYPSLGFSKMDAKTDIVVAVKANASKTETVPLTFGHITAAAAFSVQGDHDYDDCKFVIKSLRLTAPNAGTYNVDMSNNLSGKWTNINGSEEFTFKEGEEFDFPYTVDNNTVSELFPVERFFLIPGSTFYVDVEYEVYKNGVKIVDRTGIDCGTCSITIPSSNIGKLTIYDLIMTVDADEPIQFTSTISSWGTTGEQLGGDL